LEKILKTKKDALRQAEAKQLEEYLHVKPGSVTPLALLNLTAEQKEQVQFVVDEEIVSEYVAIHPMINTSTIWLKRDDLIALLNSNGIKSSNVKLTEAVEEKKLEVTKENPKAAKAPKESKDVANKEAKDNAQGTTSANNPYLLSVQYKKFENFSDWYSDVIIKSEMIEYYDISGCYILRPWSYQIWEMIQKFFDEKIKELGVENAYFPLFVSYKALNQEKDHVEGFKPEVAWVTKSGEKELEIPIAIRPTSETIMYPSYSKWIRSHRDLPLKLNQWTNVVRWEFKNPTPFIRTREFLWQEGHTAHATLEEADKQVFDILELYRQVYEDLLAVPVIPGRKSENEKFAGGFYTTTVETLIPANGKGIQCATSHNLGQNFSKMFDIKFLNEKREECYAWQTSWGLTTRSIGVMIMTHGDDNGLVLPPRIAPIQVIMIPIITSKDDPKLIKEKMYEISAQLKGAKVRNKVDDSDIHNPGWKFAHWELKGVPIRIEYGKKDMEKGQVTIFCRDNKERLVVKYADVTETIVKLLDTIQERIFTKAKSELDNKKKYATDFESFLKLVSDNNMVLTPWCNIKQCEENVKAAVKDESEKSGLDEKVAGSCKTLCIPLQQPELKEDHKCFFCGAKAEVHAVWGRSY
jgi:prolyl-tRNA synthetase